MKTIITLSLLIALSLSATPATAKKSTLDALSCTEEGAIAKWVSGEWVCGEDLTAGGSGTAFSVVDDLGTNFGTFVGIRHNTVGSVNGEQRGKSVDVFLELLGDVYLIPVLGTGFGATGQILYDGPGCSGIAAIEASQAISNESSFDGLYGRTGYVAPNAARTLYAINGSPLAFDTLSIATFDGTCYEFIAPETIEAILLQAITELAPLYTPPFSLVPNL